MFAGSPHPYADHDIIKNVWSKSIISCEPTTICALLYPTRRQNTWKQRQATSTCPGIDLVVQSMLCGSSNERVGMIVQGIETRLAKGYYRIPGHVFHDSLTAPSLDHAHAQLASAPHALNSIMLRFCACPAPSLPSSVSPEPAQERRAAH